MFAGNLGCVATADRMRSDNEECRRTAVYSTFRGQNQIVEQNEPLTPALSPLGRGEGVRKVGEDMMTRHGMTNDPSGDFVSQLCPACGLCCNGVLFGDVELQPGDNAGRLIDLGMALKKKGMKRAFVQPCRCFDGKLCRIYADRPKRCATFECGLLKRVQTGAMPAPAALKRIAAATKLAEKVRRLLRRLGDSDEQLALTKRYSRVMSQPIDLAAGEEAGEARGELMLAVNDLMHVLQREFLK